MKRIIIFALTVLVVCSLIGCSDKDMTFNIGKASELQIKIGIGNEIISIHDTELVKAITDNINSLRYEKRSEAVGMVGWSYMLTWKDNEGNVIEELAIVDTEGYQILYDGYYYGVGADLAINVGLLRERCVTRSVYDILDAIKSEKIVAASFDSLIPNYIYDIEDVSIVDELLNTLDGATFEMSEPEQISSSMEFIYITTDQHEYRIGVINNSVLSILVDKIDGEQKYYKCSDKDEFLLKMLELQGR